MEVNCNDFLSRTCFMLAIKISGGLHLIFRVVIPGKERGMPYICVCVCIYIFIICVSCSSSWSLLMDVVYYKFTLDFKCYWFLLGEWMNSSAGLAFAPHVISMAVGEVCHIPTDLWSVSLLCRLSVYWSYGVDLWRHKQLDAGWICKQY